MGEELSVRNVKRDQMGAYLCIASNDVPPAVSKRVILNVNCKYIQLKLVIYTYHVEKKVTNFYTVITAARTNSATMFVNYFVLEWNIVNLNAICIHKSYILYKCWHVILKARLRIRVVKGGSAMIIMSLQWGYKWELMWPFHYDL